MSVKDGNYIKDDIFLYIAVRFRSNKKSKISAKCITSFFGNSLSNKEILDIAFHGTLFAQTLSIIPRLVFQKLELRHKTERASRKFGFKEQFTAMAFIQLASRRSMRDGLRCLAASGRQLYHWSFERWQDSSLQMPTIRARWSPSKTSSRKCMGARRSGGSQT